MSHTGSHSEPDVAHVEFVLDIACVWSYLGYARFARVAAEHRKAGGRLEVVFRPFQVAPYAPERGESLFEVHKRDFGAEAEQKEETLKELGRQEGVEFDFDKAVFTNTFQAHRLVALAAEQGLGETVVDRLFRAYFTDGINVADPEELRSLAAETGVVWSEAGAEELRAELARVRDSGIHAVPTLTVNGGQVLTGAWSENELRSALGTKAA
ncbi:DsbA family oxidoreductase [Actinopolyspora mortivallis]|uniref:Disulfide bond formation protein DsbA n=1 Tax=Actinopolyspora mortivallis TaxID=33906 RepID=A0A2T0GTE3_ACTMO|nr:DsbA family oxidoreductase [Actinopolyspora mortivallis]PRW62360.1 disulfide bond formation protein DsbA [Actinopolyspora mortivallis]